jgi:transcriptional regulator with XRE-family HTH domain
MVAEDLLISIPEALRAERRRAGLTLEDLAERTDLSKAHLSRLESGERQPSVAALLTISRALGTSVSVLLGEGRGGPPLSLFGPKDAPHTVNGLTVTPCSGFAGSGTLEALHVQIPPERPAPPFARHRGEEWIYVLSGSLRLEYEEKAYRLTPGASAHFDATRPHRLGAEDAPVEALIVVADDPRELRSRPLFNSTTPRPKITKEDKT